MLDTLTIARRLTEAGLEPTQANAITDAIRTAVAAGDTATKVDLAMLRADIYRAMLFQAGVIVGGCGRAAAGARLRAVAT